MAAYGGRCACCGQNETDFLAIDHINGRGCEHRKKRKGNASGIHLYRWLIKHNFPSGFRVLCHNCNWSMYLNGGICAHQMKKSKRAQ